MPLPKTFIRFADLKRSGLYNNYTTLDRHIKAGLFPMPEAFGGNIKHWDDAEVALYREAKKAAEAAGIRGKAALAEFVKAYIADRQEAA